LALLKKGIPMKSKFLIIVLIVISISCSGKVFNTVSCVENKDFKKEWKKNIEFLDNYYAMRENISVYEEATRNYSITEISEENDRYFSSLEFVSKYVTINYVYKTSFSGSIPYRIYFEEKENWNEWYEKNKCSDIQLK
jgi:hypothetical protein